MIVVIFFPVSDFFFSFCLTELIMCIGDECVAEVVSIVAGALFFVFSLFNTLITTDNKRRQS